MAGLVLSDLKHLRPLAKLLFILCSGALAFLLCLGLSIVFHRG